MPKQTNVLFIWKVDRKVKIYFKNAFKKYKSINLIFPIKMDEKYLTGLSGNADIIIGWRPPLKIIENSPRLKAYINPGTGIKHHIKTFRNSFKNIILINSHGHAYSTAQHAVAMLFALMNRIVFHHNKMEEGKWRTSDDKDIYSATVKFKNRNIGLFGYGAINKNVHKFLSGFENNFHVIKRIWNKKGGDFPTEIIKYSLNELNSFLKNIDILIIAVPHTFETEGIIGKKELKLLGKEGLLVNVARGVVVDEKSLYESLRDKIIAGAALDVWYNYKPVKDKQGREYPYSYPFHKLKNVVMSPHRAASPFDDTERWDDIIENIKRIAAGRTDLLNVVDLQREY